MNQVAHDAIESLWQQTVRTRALCPVAGPSAIGTTEFDAPTWYRDRGAQTSVKLNRQMTAADVQELSEIGAFVNRSFVIAMAAILEETDVVPCYTMPVLIRDGAEHAQLTKCLRHRFAHGDWTCDHSKVKHQRTRALLQKLFPNVPQVGTEWVIPIDGVLEPLKDGVLRYVATS